jgi:RNA polymerase sigma-70 factor (ECF subfamily)
MSLSSAILATSPARAVSAEQQLQREENLAIAAGLKRQDSGLVNELIDRYQHRLMRYLLYLTNDRSLAEDIFQEAWMRVLLRGSQYNGKARFDTWLFTIARNLVIDFRRKRKTTSLDELFEGSGDDDRPMSIELTDGSPTPFEHCLTSEDRMRVTEALHSLDRVHREVITLRFHEEMSLEEIAKVTRANLSTVKSRLYRGIAALRPVLAKTGKIEAMEAV